MRKGKTTATEENVSKGRSSADGRRDAIAEAALKLFAEAGFENVSNKDLGRAAGVAPGLIYYYFKDKDDLFRYVLRKSLKDMLACYSEIKGEANGDGLNAWIAANISLSRPISGFLKIMLDYAMSGGRSADTDEAIRQFYARETSILKQALAGRKNAGQLAILISVFLDGLMASRIIRPDLDVDEITHTLLALLQPEPRP
jgi:AcrR family transcriptional regulator